MELESNRGLIDSRIERGQEYAEAIEQYLSDVVLPPPGVNPGADDVTGMLERLGPPRLTEYQRGALDDLLSGGVLPLVRNNTIRQGVLTYARLLADEEGIQQSRERFWSDQIGPYYFEHGSLLAFMPVGEELGVDARAPLVEAFVRSRHFSNLLAERRAFEMRLISRRERLQSQVDELAALVSAGR